MVEINTLFVAKQKDPSFFLLIMWEMTENAHTQRIYKHTTHTIQNT